MGRAKQNGTFEERKAKAIARRQHEEQDDLFTELWIKSMRTSKPVILIQCELGEGDIGIRHHYIEPPSRHELKMLRALGIGLAKAEGFNPKQL